MAFLENSMGLFSDPETTVGVSSDPLDRLNSFADPVKTENRIRELAFNPDVQLDGNNNFVNGAFVKDAKTIGKKLGSVDFSMKYAPGTVEDNGDLTFTHKNPYTKYFASSGFRCIPVYDKAGTTNDINAYQYPAKYVYYPTIASYENTITIDVLERDPNPTKDALYAEMSGSMGNIVISADATGEPWTMAANYVGGVDDVYEVPSASVPNLQFDPDDLVKSTADSYLNTTYILRNKRTQEEITGLCTKGLTIDPGVQRSVRECQQGNSGIKSYFISDMVPVCSFSIELPQLADWDYWSALTDEELFEIEIRDRYKNESGEIVLAYLMPSAQLVGAPIVTDELLRRLDLSWELMGNEDKLIPDVKYNDILGVEQTWDGSEMSEFDKYEASFYMVLSEIPLGYTPTPVI